MHGISPLWEKVLDMLKSLEPNISEDVLSIFCIYFSLLDDGNICIPLNSQRLYEKWMKKWKGLFLAENEENYEQQRQGEPDFKKIIQTVCEPDNTGVMKISAESLPNLIEDVSIYSGTDVQAGTNAQGTAEYNSSPKYDKPFVIDSVNDCRWLFASKYHKAKRSIENRINAIMKANNTATAEEAEKTKNTLGNEGYDEKTKIREYFKKLTDDNSHTPMILKDEQLDTIVRGLGENLIITGGPGTGKTTVVCYLLWELMLRNPAYLDYHVYLAAPSGKAADRMKESISGTLSKLQIKDDIEKKIFNKLNSAQSSTIHRLLSYNPAENSFSYNAQNRFEDNSIFVIDEASMIDITLFSSLIEAIPDTAAVYILGDKDQLPSVQAGAVLGELLAKKLDSVAELKESSRFNDNSDVGRLKNAIQQNKPLDRNLAFFESWESWKQKNTFEIPDNACKNSSSKEFPVKTFVLKDSNSNYGISKEKQIEEIITKWSEVFYDDLMDTIPQDLSDQKALNTLWNKIISARILCAERRGIRGTERINENICKHIIKRNRITSLENGEFFTGQLLILTKNQTMFSLYNGDSGIVIEHKGLKYLMVKKDIKEDTEQDFGKFAGGIFRNGSYMFYPLYLLPKESIETAYAITIHKSQGSGYNAILIFLPEQSGHPLLNRQIAYTAITRTEGSTYIVADYDTLEKARSTVIERDTLINL